MITHIRPALVMITLFTVATGVVAPLGFAALGGAVMPYQAGGSLIMHDGTVVGSALIGQSFTSDKYFHGRPSALMGTDPKDASKQVATPYDASESGASNLAATSAALVARVGADVKALGGQNIPADMVTSSGSGLDPDISTANAALQVARVAHARGIPADRVQALVEQNTSTRVLGLLGEPRVNVLALNLALDGGR